ncbi:hypothetical protein HN903_02865 [archaeon]|nr:hypothetical protein [archaeon]MBT7128674.1 hypothetical protein [archaeon]
MAFRHYGDSGVSAYSEDYYLGLVKESIEDLKKKFGETAAQDFEKIEMAALKRFKEKYRDEQSKSSSLFPAAAREQTRRAMTLQRAIMWTEILEQRINKTD